MGRASRLEYLCQIHPRYRKASRTEKGRILDEFCRVAGYHRKYALRVLNGPPPEKRPRKRRPRRPTYGAKVVLILAGVWEAAGYPWSVRLRALIPPWLPWVRKHFPMSPGVESQLLKISARQIDRRLREHKKKAGRRHYGRTKPGSLLKHHVPIKTDRWNVERPGVLRGGRDSVHSGSSLQERRQRPHRAEELDPRPQTHGVGSLRHGDIKRHYDAAKTPFARVLECKEVRPMVVARLTALQKQLDPFALSRSVDVQLDRIHALANHVRSPSPQVKITSAVPCG